MSEGEKQRMTWRGVAREEGVGGVVGGGDRAEERSIGMGDVDE